jgi:hypothetical protein
MILSTLQILLLVGAAVLLIMALLSPLESLRWWAGWSEKEVADASPLAEPATRATSEPTGDERYVVWLSGIGSVPGQTEDPFEVRFLSELRRRVPSVVVIDDAFAYSVRENPLAGKGLLSAVLRLAQTRHAEGKPSVLIGSIMQLRNTLQVAVSADGRYGPIYNLGLAEAIGKRLIASGYPLAATPPIALIGYSGGGQIAVGAARYLKQWLGAPIHVISIGGVIAADPGLRAVEHLNHLQGQKDPVPTIGDCFFVGRWPLLKYSYWNRAVAAGKVTTLQAGPVGHMGEAGYFGEAHVERTASIVADLVAATRVRD